LKEAGKEWNERPQRSLYVVFSCPRIFSTAAKSGKNGKKRN